MPKRPPTTGYARLAQADQLSDSDDDAYLAESSASLQPNSAPRFAPITKPGHRSNITSPRLGPSKSNRRQPHRRAGSVDIKAINARLERWADEIAAKFKRGRRNSRGGQDERLEIQHSVFRAPDGVRPITTEGLGDGIQQTGVMTSAEFETIVESVRAAIRQEVHPSMISQGSSGSYFARNPDGKIVGVFKPKDEEPYAAGNPKWNKWIHRNLFPCFFGRACLIPNLSYVSEAAAYVLDTQLRTNMVPYTDVVWLSSKSFHYPYWDRRAFYRRKKPFPAKPGSFQVFLKGFKDANVFLREHPWPDQYWAGFRTSDGNRRRNKNKTWTDSCRPSVSGNQGEEVPSDDDYENDSAEDSQDGENRFTWTDDLKRSFREELEKLVILDYIMRNTDRGLDNWMVKVDWETGQVSIASEPVQLNMVSEDAGQEDHPRPVDAADVPSMPSTAAYSYKKQTPMEAEGSASSSAAKAQPTMSLGAIDNSLSWPWKHPDAWRSYPFGWLFLPVDLIGRPFSQKTRDHFLPLLTSTAWWSQTQMALKRVFQIDDDFQERMFAKQIAVMKGQAWNVVEALKSPDHGPLELTRRAKVCVWDDLVDVPVAVPMRVTSSEIRRNSSHIPRPELDEADIAGSVDLLGMGDNDPSAPADMPNPGRFEINTPNAQSPELKATSPQQEYSSTYHGRPSLNVYEPARGTRHQQRRYSYAVNQSRRNSSSIAQQLYDDGDIEGDLGYAAAEGQMGRNRKVIVERLEPVKAKNPVFTWC